MQEWTKCKWGDLVTLEYGKSLKGYSAIGGSVPVYGTNGEIGFTEKALYEGPSVIIGRKGAYRGVHFSNVPFFVIDTAFYIKPKSDQLDLRYAYYHLKTVDLNGMDSGSAIPSTSREDFYELPARIPPYLKQVQIAEILSSLDDKIELNNKINQELEALAQAIFKHWFIDFEFPDENGQPYKSSGGKMVRNDSVFIPAGWDIVPLRETIKVKHGYAYEGEFFSTDETSEVLVTPGNFRIGGGFKYDKYKYYNGNCPKDYILCPEDLIITMTDLSKEGDTLGYPALVPRIPNKRFHHNQRIGKVEFKRGDWMKFYVYWLMRTPEYRSFILSGASGTTVKHTSPSRICEYLAIIPTEDMLKRFNSTMQSLYSLQANNIVESIQLAELRDTLLPKLVSGELVVSHSKVDLEG